MRFPDLSIEIAHAGIVAGIDEAGRGPWAGPVVAAIVILDRSHIPAGIHDSKLLSRTKREALYDAIAATSSFAVGLCCSQEVDSYNILGATKRAMRLAYDALEVKPDCALIDGNQLPDLPCYMDAIIDGDALCLSIAAASIIAKVTRDRIMTQLATEFPHYGWERNAGYGTREHQDALARHGITPYHRRSFAPVRKLLEKAVA